MLVFCYLLDEDLVVKVDLVVLWCFVWELCCGVVDVSSGG